METPSFFLLFRQKSLTVAVDVGNGLQQLRSHVHFLLYAVHKDVA